MLGSEEMVDHHSVTTHGKLNSKEHCSVTRHCELKNTDRCSVTRHRKLDNIKFHSKFFLLTIT
jgi:hypothetical protein